MLPAANRTLVSDRQQAFLSAATRQRLAHGGVTRTRWNRVRLARSRAGWFLVNLGLRLAHPRGDDARVAPDSSFSVAFLARVRS
jgi:hypothetical protein